MSLPVLERLSLRPTVPVHVRYTPEFSTRLGLRDTSDLDVLGDVLVDGQYELPDEPEVIVDLGSHIGISILAFHARYPGARIYGYEADPRTYRRLSEHVGHVPQVRVENAAAAGEDGTIAMHLADQPWASSAIGSGGPVVEVPATSLASIMAAHGLDRIDLLKIDVEGSEYDVLAAALRARLRIEMIIGELHDWKPGVSFTGEEFVRLLEDHDYEVALDTSGRDQVFRARRR